MNMADHQPGIPPTAASSDAELIEVAVVVDSEAAEAVSELFNRLNGGFYNEDSAAGEASGGGAVIEATGFDDFERPTDGEYQLVVKTYIKPGARGAEIRRRIEEGLWHLSQIYPIPEPQIRTVRKEDWAHAWKQFYKPLRIGRRILLKPAWETVEPEPDDIVIELEPGMAFGTGMHPTTRLCVAALEELVQPGDAMLDVGTGSGILSVLAAKLGAALVFATDIDPLAIDATRENLQRNGVRMEGDTQVRIEQESVPAGQSGRFQVVVANILTEVLVKLFDGAYGNVPLAEPIASGGHMILSGILDEKADMVIEAGQRHGLALRQRKQEGDWVALIMQRVPV
jgi:ribosomal protein L11 methyltransferase